MALKGWLTLQELEPVLGASTWSRYLEGEGRCSSLQMRRSQDGDWSTRPWVAVISQVSCSCPPGVHHLAPPPKLRPPTLHAHAAGSGCAKISGSSVTSILSLWLQDDGVVRRLCHICSSHSSIQSRGAASFPCSMNLWRVLRQLSWPRTATDGFIEHHGHDFNGT